MNQQRGRLGEALAALYLEHRGYRVGRRRFRSGRREIDLLVERGDTMVAVEVKWRRPSEGREAATEAWRRAQRERAGEAVLLAMQEIDGAQRRAWRLDFVVIEEHARGFKLEHFAGVSAPGMRWW